MNNPVIRLEVPYQIWRIEAAFRGWLAWRQIKGFFWEVDRNDEYVTIELLDGFTDTFVDDSIIGEDNRGGLNG